MIFKHQFKNRKEEKKNKTLIRIFEHQFENRKSKIKFSWFVVIPVDHSTNKAYYKYKKINPKYLNIDVVKFIESGEDIQNWRLRVITLNSRVP